MTSNVFISTLFGARHTAPRAHPSIISAGGKEMNSDITRGLLESAIDVEKRKLGLTKDKTLAARFEQRIERLERLLAELFPERDTVDLSGDWDAILRDLERTVGREFTGKPLASGFVLPRIRES